MFIIFLQEKKLCSRRDYVRILQCSTERGFEVLAENSPGGLLARGSMHLEYFVDFKKPEGKH